MCLVPMKVKSVNPAGVKFAFVPCGKCAECRASYRSGWFFRLSVEMQEAKKQGWKIGFFTLTYNDEHLPFIPSALIPDDWSGSDRISCFCRDDVRRLILRLRKKYHKDCGATGFRYLIASEYGEHTHRPHYHGVIAFPPEIEASDMLSSIKRFWSTSDEDNMQSLGFVFPSNETYADEKFLCTSPFAVANYASKYCCKDLSFDDVANALHLDRNQRRLYGSFHIQSRSLGLSLLANATDEQKYELLTQGLQVVGSPRKLPIPLYIKNKIFFTPDYQTDLNGNRVVRRLATPFVKKYAQELYDGKVSFYRGYFEKMMTQDYWSSLGFELKKAAHCCAYANRVFNGSVFDCVEYAAKYYLSYFGVPRYMRKSELVPSWLQRYESCWIEDKSWEDITDPQDVALNTLFHMVSCQDREVAYEKMRKDDRVMDYHNNQ